MEQSLRNRLVFGPTMLGGVLLLLWLDYAVQAHWRYHTRGVGLMILLLAILPVAVRELAILFAAEHVRPYRVLSALGAGSLALHAFLTQFAFFQPVSGSVMALIIVAVMISAAVRRAWARQSQEAIVHMAGTVLATLYLGGLAWFLMALRVKQSRLDTGHQFHGSTMVIVMIILVVKFADIGAYVGGRLFGRHKLIQWLSPGKTWEGLVFGVATSALVGALCSRWIGWPDYHLPWWKGLVFGLLIGAVGQAGDLLESLMKRDAEVKDSGRLIPGFGGVLDVIDSPLLAAPCAYLLFSLW